MPKKYYNFPNTEYPPLLEALIERVRQYICESIYPNETYANSKSKFIFGDIASASALRRAAKKTSLPNVSTPFTIYSVKTAEEVKDGINHYAKTQRYFSDTLSCLVYARPKSILIEMITFFHTALDQIRAQTILHKENSSKTKLDVPITINGVLTTFPILISFEIGSGSYDSEFGARLDKGNLHDLVHNITVEYYDIIIDAELAPVDDIEVALRDLEKRNTEQEDLYVSGIVPLTPALSSSVPTDGATDVAVGDNLVFVFNTPMNEMSTEAAVDYIPLIIGDYSWDTTGKILTLEVASNLTSGETYEITIAKTAMSDLEVTMNDDEEISFTTVG